MEAHKEEVVEEVVSTKQVIPPLVESSNKSQEKIETKSEFLKLNFKIYSEYMKYY